MSLTGNVLSQMKTCKQVHLGKCSLQRTEIKTCLAFEKAVSKVGGESSTKFKGFLTLL